MMVEAKPTGCKYIDDYLSALRSGERPASREMLLAADYIEEELSQPGVFIDMEKTQRAKELIEKYFEFKLMDWELFVLALVHCYYQDDTLVFSEFLIMMGRGNGKNGFISGLSWYLTTPDHGIQGYNVDIIANSEDQAKTSFDDVYEMLGKRWEKLKRFYYRSKELIRSLKTDSYIKFNTSNARTKDGKRSACLIFDEEHEYENDDSVRVFKSGFGKRKHSRVFKITTNGYVRDGVLDKDLEIAADVLRGEIRGSRMCPLLYKADGEADLKNPAAWVKACPSLPYLDTLRIQMEQEFSKIAYDKSVELDFYTKRMNLPRSNMEIAVTQWENIAATNRPLPDDMQGWQCIVGIDYASLRDWASLVYHFRRGDVRFDLHHSWLCLRSPDLNRIKAPWREWADRGIVTPVDDAEISPYLLTDHIEKMAQRFLIRRIALDNFRFALMKKALEGIGFSMEQKNVYLLRPSDMMKVQPVIDSCFNQKLFIWDDDPALRWAANNTKLVRSGRKDGTDTGNYYFAKIEGKSRKTDPFMALAAAMTQEGELYDAIPAGFTLGVIT